MKISLTINHKEASVEADPQTPLLWVIRDTLDLKATKYGCGKALCGACTVHLDGESVRSCSVPAEFAGGKNIITLEGLSENKQTSHPIIQAWTEENVPQCGYCQPGFMMAAARFIELFPEPSDEDIRANITNLCRCGTQPRIIKAIKRAAAIGKESKN